MNMSKNQYIIAGVAVAILVAGGAFYGGIQYGVNKTKAIQMAGRGNFVGGGNNQQHPGFQGTPNGQNGQGGGQMRQQRMGGGGFVGGEITSKDDKSLTIKSQDGSSKIVFFSDSTKIGKTTDGSLSDLATGQQVMVNGQSNADGSIAAQNIQIRPEQQ